MFLDYTPEQRALRAELRAYFAEMLTPEVKEKLGVAGEGSDLFRVLVRKMGQDGWLGLGWPKEYGGQGRSAMDQYIMFDEVQRSRSAVPVRHGDHDGPVAHALRHAGAESQVPAGDAER